MTPKTKIFLITRDTNTRKQIDAVSQNGSPIVLDHVLEDIGHVQDYLNGSDVCAGIVDIDPDPQAMLSELEELTRSNPHICTIVVSENITQELILSAMQAGARHFLQKNSLRSELSGVMARLLQHSGQKRLNGSILTVFSASGGCGATTVALNLAMELKIKSSKPVLLIDLDRCYGAASSYLDMKSDYGIEHVLSYEGKIDRNLIESSSCTYQEDFHVLLNTPSSKGSGNKQSRDLNPESLLRVLETCRQNYGFTVIDAPRMDEETVRILSEQSDFTLVVFQLTLKDLKFARSIISMFKQLGLSEDKIIPLANRFQKRGPLVRIEDGKKALGTDQVFKVRSDWRSAMECLNNAKTLAEVAPRSAIRKDLQKLVSSIQFHKSVE